MKTMEVIKMKKILFISVILVSFFFISLGAQEITFKIVVNSSNPVSSLTVKDVSNYFLKKVTRWKNGQKVLPVDLKDTSTVREIFSKDIHGRKVSSIKAYWQKQIFSGRNVPPAEKGTENEVLAFIDKNPGAIGYVSSSTSRGRYRVKVLNIEE